LILTRDFRERILFRDIFARESRGLITYGYKQQKTLVKNYYNACLIFQCYWVIMVREDNDYDYNVNELRTSFKIILCILMNLIAKIRL
jgi:hypothetical protein